MNDKKDDWVSPADVPCEMCNKPMGKQWMIGPDRKGYCPKCASSIPGSPLFDENWKVRKNRIKAMINKWLSI